MDKTIRKCKNFEEMKADEYRYWQSRPVHERVALKGFEPDAFRLQRLLSILNAHRVKYPVVGAYAAAIHVQPCATTLPVLCTAFRGKADQYPNLTVRKIPKQVLSRCGLFEEEGEG
jgi:hypothetical protein